VGALVQLLLVDFDSRVLGTAVLAVLAELQAEVPPVQQEFFL